MSEKHTEKAAVLKRKAQYSRPTLIRYGAVADLTLGTGGTKIDGNPTTRFNGKAGN
ncbi:MAG TPA: lasso RiPP family leader peptide-containing protein [Candidatus Binataceae bacterium]|nr:lasso RiPP family leader peptide-containing protein [Candidatus Binataceae bacterium]